MTTQWTDSAKRALDDYFGEMRGKFQATGADAREVIDDLGRHIDHEIAAANLRVVTEQDVRRILGQIGTPDPAAGKAVFIGELPTDRKPAKQSKHVFLFIFGVLLPVVTLSIELATHMCAGVFFDPIPTWWHVALVAMVPLANLFAWISLRFGTRRWHWVMFGNGAATAISLFYALLYMPLVPAGIIAIIVFGWGLLPLSPLMASMATLVLRSKLRRTAPDYAPRFRWGLAAGALTLALVALPQPITRQLARASLSDNPQKSQRALNWLRSIGSCQTLLRDCYGATRWARDPIFGFSLTGTPISTEDARTLYFRVTGKPFNAVPPPQRNFARGGWEELNDVTWDADQGGQTVGGRVQGVSMSQSRLDGLVDANAGWCYTEWILEFKNVATVAREARAQIALPAGGAVTRLTLWVNGEEREAAFAGNQQVRQAYQQVAIVQRRDPVLVTSCGPDRVLMQCFPVPAGGGTIKVRLGITAPIVPDSAGDAAFQLPHFLERNFTIHENSQHSLWLEGEQPLHSPSPRLIADRPRSSRYAVKGLLSETELRADGSLVRVRRDPNATQFWAADHGVNDGSVIVQRLRQRPAVPPKNLVLVVDAGESMQNSIAEIADSLARLPQGLSLSVLLARDGVHEMVTSSSDFEEIARQLCRVRPSAGHDNVPALVRAWDLAGSAGSVLWIHGPQPMLLGSLEHLQQRLFWKLATDPTSGPMIYDLQIGPGPDRVLEKLESAWAAVVPVSRATTLRDSLSTLFAKWSANAQFEWVRERASESDSLQASQKSSKHLVRLWAFDEAKKRILARQIPEAVRIAGLYQLVTPVSGAVVLETKQQFEQAGLTPVDSHSVPLVPEPGTFALIGLGLGLLLVLRWRKKTLRA
jgi:hypothetical protein